MYTSLVGVYLFRVTKNSVRVFDNLIVLQQSEKTFLQVPSCFAGGIFYCQKIYLRRLYYE